MVVCSFEGAARLIDLDKNYWNVISICGPREQKASLRHARTVHYACFDDVEEACSSIYRSRREGAIEEIFGFIRSLGSGAPAAPLIVHCQQGISRSAAVALAWIYGKLPAEGDRVSRAVDLLLELRPQAKTQPAGARVGSQTVHNPGGSSAGC
jgi:predicted protein tyrosine phosphatase